VVLRGQGGGAMEDPELELDVKLLSKHNRIRKRIESIYNKRIEEFPSKLEYDDYLEEREDIVFNLCEGINVAATEAKVTAYESANAASIAANIAKKAMDSRALAQPDVAADPEAATAEDAVLQQTFVPRGGANQLPPQPAPVAQQPPKKSAKRATEVEMKAGGWAPDLPKLRTMHDAFTSLVLSES